MKTRIIKITSMFLLGTVISAYSVAKDVQQTDDTAPTMTDYWEGRAYFKNFYNEQGYAHRATEIVPVNGVWYRFERYIIPFPGSPSNDAVGMNVCKSTDKGMSWTKPVVILTPGGTNDWSWMGTDCGAWYDGARWHLLFQSISLNPGSPWNICYIVCDEEDATAGAWYTPPGVVNPVIRNGDIWNTIAVGDNHCTQITGGEKRVYDEGTPKILYENGTIYVTFHGASNTNGTIYGYRGIATTTDFISYTKAADDCIFDRHEAKDWNVEWIGDNGTVGGGAAAYIKDGEYWYMLIESPDISLTCSAGQNWPIGLLRSKTLTNTQWENFSNNPLPELTPVGPTELGCGWQYKTLWQDDGVTYLAISRCHIENAYKQYRLEWKKEIKKKKK